MCARVVSGEGKETTRGGGGDVKSPPAPNGTGAALQVVEMVRGGGALFAYFTVISRRGCLGWSAHGLLGWRVESGSVGGAERLAAETRQRGGSFSKGLDG
jgi:hypothetical protein